MLFIQKLIRRFILLAQQFKALPVECFYTIQDFFKGKVEIQNPRVLIVIHAFWPEELRFIVERLNRITLQLEIVVTICNSSNQLDNISELKNLKESHKFNIIEVQNQGRDVKPFLKALKLTAENQWDLIIKLHTKRSQKIWFKALVLSLVRSDKRIRRLVAITSNSAPVLICHPLFRLPGHLIPTSNPLYEKIVFALRTLNLELPKQWFFPAGTMFAINEAAGEIYLLRYKQLKDYTFEFESDYSQSSLAHIYERLFGLDYEGNGLQITATSPLDFFDLRAIISKIN